MARVVPLPVKFAPVSTPRLRLLLVEQRMLWQARSELLSSLAQVAVRESQIASELAEIEGRIAAGARFE